MRYVVYNEDCLIATYFGHRVELTPYTYTDFPRGQRNCFRLVSTSQSFVSPDIWCQKVGTPYNPTGEFYQDIFRFVTGDIAAKKFNPIKCARKAKEYVKSNYLVYPIKANQGLEQAFSIAPMKDLGKLLFNSSIVGAFIIPIERAFGHEDRTLAETYERQRKEVERQMAIYNYWYAGEVYLLQVYPSPMVRDALIATGEVGIQIVSEWEHKLIPLKAEVFGRSLCGYNEDLIRIRDHMSAIADWVFNQINKFSDSDMPISTKSDVRTILNGLGD